jgi:hypothetical protein
VLAGLILKGQDHSYGCMAIYTNNKYGKNIIGGKEGGEGETKNHSRIAFA